MKRKIQLLSLILMALLVLSGCSGLLSRPGTVTSGDQAATQQAMIVQAVQATATTMAMETQISQLQTQVAKGGGGVQPTASDAAAGETPLAPTATLAPTSTTIPTNTPVPPTSTPVPTATLAPVIITPITPTFTATAIPCNVAQFVDDVTIPDGTVFTPGSEFTKTWRLKNVGSCTWTTAYDLIFSGGDKLDGPSAVDFPGNVAPGDVIDLSVDLTAPDDEGSYRGNWKLRDGAGNVFGLGKAGAAFYVDIKVSSPVIKFPLDMVAKACTAQWTSGAGSLNCPGSDNNSRGFVLRIDEPLLETGYEDDEAALLTHPQMVNDGIIRGKYPAFEVEASHKFNAVIGCEYKADDCDVTFQLDYQIDGGSIKTLKSWHEVYDNAFNAVEVSLKSLAGEKVSFILTVKSNGSADDDRALWLAPRITK